MAGNQKQSSSVGALCHHKRHRFSEDERIRPIEDEKLSIWGILEVTTVGFQDSLMKNWKQ